MKIQLLRCQLNWWTRRVTHFVIGHSRMKSSYIFMLQLVEQMQLLNDLLEFDISLCEMHAISLFVIMSSFTLMFAINLNQSNNMDFFRLTVIVSLTFIFSQNNCHFRISMLHLFIFSIIIQLFIEFHPT